MTATHAQCPTHPGHWYHATTGMCSCGDAHRGGETIDRLTIDRGTVDAYATGGPWRRTYRPSARDVPARPEHWAVHPLTGSGPYAGVNLFTVWDVTGPARVLRHEPTTPGTLGAPVLIGTKDAVATVYGATRHVTDHGTHILLAADHADACATLEPYLVFAARPVGTPAYAVSSVLDLTPGA